MAAEDAVDVCECALEEVVKVVGIEHHFDGVSCLEFLHILDCLRGGF